MANRKFMKLNQYPSSIQSPASSPNDDYTTHLFKTIFLQFNDEWIFFIPNLFHSIISAISNFFHSILSWLMVIPNFFLSLIYSLFNFFHSLLMIIPNLFNSLVSKLSVIPDFFHSLFSNITSLFHSLVSKLSVIPYFLFSEITSLFHSLVSKTTNLYQSLVLVTTNLFHSLVLHLSEIPDLFYDLINKITKLLHSLLAKFDETWPPETRAHILKVGTPFVIAGLGVALLCLICYYCWPAVVGCMTQLKTGLTKLVVGLFELLKVICSCCSRNAGKMMKAPGTGGTVMIVRAVFESNPAAYFSNLRAGGIKAPLLS